MHLPLGRCRFARTVITFCAAVAAVVPAFAQTAPPEPRVTRTVLAQTKLHFEGMKSLFMGAVGVVVPAGQSSDISAVADGILYQMSGATEIEADGVKKTLDARKALFVATGKHIALKAGSDMPSTLMHFLIGRAADLDRSGATAPSTVIEIFRSSRPIPALKPGVYDLNLTAIALPPHAPPNASYRRSGAALDYVLFGTGANTVGGTTAQKGVGSVIYEPPGQVHLWGNPGDEELRFVVFNINAEGTPAFVPDTPPKPR